MFPSSSPPNLKPLNLRELDSFKQSTLKKLETINKHPIDCILCEKKFTISNEREEKTYLAHLVAIHKLVISDVSLIGDLKKYLAYWRDRLRTLKLDDVCFTITTNTGPSDDPAKAENFYLLSDNLPEDRQLREGLNIFKLEKALSQQERERNDHSYERECLFCEARIGMNRADLIGHMAQEHNFNIGNPDNIVYFDEFYMKLKSRMDRFQCLFCEKIFYNNQVLREHMRKKLHKCIDPRNSEFDRFYIINYLEYNKVWKDIKSEKTADENELFDEDASIEEWNEPAQTYFCLFCDDAFDEEAEILGHMTDTHSFDLIALNASHKLSFYQQVKLLNFIRRQMYLKTCFVCRHQAGGVAELREHLKETGHVRVFPDGELWDQPEYYFSTFEDDSLLCLLDDSAYDKEQFRVIPEEFDIEINEEALKELRIKD